ncbi:MAG TPA: endonuclease III [Thermoplasmata archaeon]|nr:endonuclease III [Thermoplasmata archaeon]
MTGPKPLDWDVLLDRLSAFYHRGDWRVPYLRDHAENPFQVLVGTILSQRTRDANTAQASARLFAAYPGPKELAAASTASLERLIRSTGYYRTKARHIRATSQAILERFGGQVPADRELLLTLPGVGPKTANCVLVFGYGIPSVPVDTHVHRIANRLGVVKTRSPEETELELVRTVPSNYWIPLNPLLVQHGQNLCRPNRPLCDRCPIREYCATGVALREGEAPPRPEDRPRRVRSRTPRGNRVGPRRPSPGRPRTPSRR